MTIENALVILLDATIEMDDQPDIRRARKRLAKKAEHLRLKRERAKSRQLQATVIEIVPAYITPNNLN